MKSISFVSGTLSAISLVFAASSFAQSDRSPVVGPLANNMCSPSNPTGPGCPEFGNPGNECCPFSDESLKTKVVPLKSATENLLKIQGVTFEWKDGGRKDIGVIAQEVAKVYPELTRTKDGLMQVDYDKLVAPLIESIRELNQRIQTLEKAQAK